jgi:recombination protein RecA
MSKSEFDKVLDKLQKTYSKMFVSPNDVGTVKRLTMSSPNMNFIFGGGYPIGKPITLFGPECLSGDTTINYREVETSTGKVLKSTVGSIKEMYDVSVKNKDITFYVNSVDESGSIISNEVLKVIDCGVKKTFEVTSVLGNSIISTEEHKFATPRGFLPLKDLAKGDDVFMPDIHNSSIVAAVKIAKILPVGDTPTYDLTCQSPHNNYVANNFVVHNSGGKTTMSYYICGQFQKRAATAEKKRVLFVDMECSFNQKYANSVGLDTENNFILLRPLDGEEGFETVDALIGTGDIGMVVWDSVAATGSRKTMESEYGKSSYGGTAALMSQALQKLTPLLSRTETSMAFINQVRAKIGGMPTNYAGGDENSNVGGWALKFYSGWRARVSKGPDIILGKDVIGNTIRVRNVKSKVGIPKRAIDLELYYDRGFDTDAEYIEFIIRLEIVNVSGAWISREDWDLKVQGRANLLNWFKSHLDRWEEAKFLVDASFTEATLLDKIDINVTPDDVTSDDEETYTEVNE